MPDGSGQTNISNHPAAEQDPKWSPDGTKIFFLATDKEPMKSMS